VVRKIPTKSPTVIGFPSEKTYEVDWRVVDESGTTKVIYGFKNEGDEFRVILKLAARENDPNEILLDLPRTVEGEIMDPSLLQMVLKFIYSRSEGVNRYEIVLSDPVLAERLNQVIHDTYVKEGSLPYELRRPSRETEDPYFDGSFAWDFNADIFFPYCKPAEGRSILKMLNDDESLQGILAGAFLTTELGKAVEMSGDWHLKLVLAENPRLKNQKAEASSVDGEVIPLFPVQWRLTMEQAW